MEFLVKFAQAHETFRLPEIKALALVEGLDMTVLDYSLDVSVVSFLSPHGPQFYPPLTDTT